MIVWCKRYLWYRTKHLNYLIIVMYTIVCGYLTWHDRVKLSWIGNLISEKLEFWVFATNLDTGYSNPLSWSGTFTCFYNPENDTDLTFCNHRSLLIATYSRRLFFFFKFRNLLCITQRLHHIFYSGSIWLKIQV